MKYYGEDQYMMKPERVGLLRLNSGFEPWRPCRYRSSTYWPLQGTSVDTWGLKGSGSTLAASDGKDTTTLV